MCRNSTRAGGVSSGIYASLNVGLGSNDDAEAVKATVRGIRRTHGVAKVRKAPAVSTKVLAMVATAPGGLTAIRDTAILLLGFAGAFRRSELVSLTVDDLVEVEDGFETTGVLPPGGVPLAVAVLRTAPASTSAAVTA